MNLIVVIFIVTFYQYFLLSFAAQGNHSENVGVSVNEVYANLLTLGNIYTLNAEDMDINKINKLHTVLSRIYGG